MVELALLEVEVPELDDEVVSPLDVDAPPVAEEPPVAADPLLEEFDPVVEEPVVEEPLVDVPALAVAVPALPDCFFS